MSGLCGYLTSAEDAHPALEGSPTLLNMCTRLARFDRSPLHIFHNGGAGVAVAAQPASFSLHHRNGLLAAVWGRPQLDGGTERVAERFAELWAARGSQACAALCGSFALAVIDTLSNQVLLAVDRSASLPLSYQRLARGLVFGSSAHALLAHPLATAELDPQSLYNYLYFHMVPAPRTIYRNHCRLLPGENLHWSHGRLERGRYWQLRFDEDSRTPFAQLKQAFVETLEHSVRQTCSGARVGTFLSGGTDSSTLAGILGRVQGHSASTYSIGFDVPGYDEMEYARLAARHFDTDHHELYVTAADVVAAVPMIAAASDQPFGNSSVVPAYYCARMAAADGITRLLGGDGGDELFGGNQRYARQAVFERYERVPSALRQLVIEPLLFGLAGRLDVAPLRKARSYVEQALVPMPARLETYNLLSRYGPAQVLERDFLASVDIGAPQAQLDTYYWNSQGLSQINRMQALDMCFTLADNDLLKVGRACELAGIEVGYPFLSDEMLAFSARLAPSHKLRGTRLRYFFKRALADHLPRAILRKSKHGFGMPFGHWLQHDAGLRSLAFDSLSDLKARRLVRADFIDALTTRLVHEHPAYHGTMVWVLMMLEQWLCQRTGPMQAALAPVAAVTSFRTPALRDA